VKSRPYCSTCGRLVTTSLATHRATERHRQLAEISRLEVELWRSQHKKSTPSTDSRRRKR